jgi:hypothetical protein
MRASSFLYSAFSLALFAASPAVAMGFHHGGGGMFHPGGRGGHDHHHHDGNVIGGPLYFGDVPVDPAAQPTEVPVPVPGPVPVYAPAPPTRPVSTGPLIIYIGNHKPSNARPLPKIIYGVGES